MSSAGLVTCLWFNYQAEEAARFYIDVFGGNITRITPQAEGVPLLQDKNKTLTVEFELRGNKFVALNGGTDPDYNKSVSLTILCESQDEIDRYWKSILQAGGKEHQCGWIEDRYGLNWQICPNTVMDWWHGDKEKTTRFVKAMMNMVKLDWESLQKAYEGVE